MLTLQDFTGAMQSKPLRTHRGGSAQRRMPQGRLLHLGVGVLLVHIALLTAPQTSAARPRSGTHLRHIVRRSPHRGCWVDIFAGPDYAAPTRRIIGPIDLPNLKLSDKNWGDAITSIKTGPRTWVRVYKDTSYRGQYLTIRPNTAYRSLRPLKFKDCIDSMIVRNHRF